MRSHFSIVPVIDLKGGQVVHARAGARARYMPVQSVLATSSVPGAVIEGLLTLAPFRRIYIADLDAIEGVGDHRQLIAALARRHEAMEFWVDCGIATADAAIEIAEDRITPVLGSECLRDVETVTAVVAQLGAGGCVLSLDYRGDAFLGPVGLAESVAVWPDRVIAMTLSRVGMSAGPDVQRLASLKLMAGPRQLFAAGGVRGRADLDDLAAMDLRGALVASALHDGRLSREMLLGFGEDR